MFGLFKSKKKSARVKILVVDDEPDLVSTIECRLRWYEHEVTTAANGQEGLEKAIKEKPDLVLLDINMPVMNGNEMLKRLREHQDLKDTPVIMLTALCERQDIATVSAYGITDYITKPFDFTELIEKITNALSNKSFV